jgi:SAM-dependent methyltransferase
MSNTAGNQMKQIKRWINKLGLFYTQLQCNREYRFQQFAGLNERPIEYAYVFNQLARLCPKKVLDVGTGMSSLPHLMRVCGFQVTATDNVKDYWHSGMINRHYCILNDDIVNTSLREKFDFITCVSVLEHIVDQRQAVRSMISLLKPDGYLLLTFPYNEICYVMNAYDLSDSSVVEKFPFITQIFSRNEIETWLNDNGVVLVDQEYWQFFEGEYWTCGERVCPPIQVGSKERHQLTCILIQRPSDAIED